MTDVFGDQPTLWQERVLLNEEFYRALREHPVPLSETALRAIGPRSMVIDTAIWLAYGSMRSRRTSRLDGNALWLIRRGYSISGNSGPSLSRPCSSRLLLTPMLMSA
jgi:hypothetical protein